MTFASPPQPLSVVSTGSPHHVMAGPNPAIQGRTARDTALGSGPSLPSHIAVAAIRAYQRYISPYKGFRCAHNALHGEGSCSAYGRRAFAGHGFTEAWRLLGERLVECHATSAIGTGLSKDDGSGQDAMGRTCRNISGGVIDTCSCLGGL